MGYDHVRSMVYSINSVLELVDSSRYDQIILARHDVGALHVLDHVVALLWPRPLSCFRLYIVIVVLLPLLVIVLDPRVI